VVPPGRPFDAVAAAMAEDDGMDDAPATSPPFSSTATMSGPVAVPQYPVQTPAESWPQPQPPQPQQGWQPQPGFVPASPQLDPLQTMADDGDHQLMPTTSPMPWGPLVAAVSVSGVMFVSALAFFVMRMMGASAATPAELVLTPVGAPPGDLIVTLDGAEVGRTLPLTTPLVDGVHVLEVKGTGITLRRDVTATGGTVRQPVLFAPGAAAVGGVDVAAGAPAAKAGAWRLLLAAVGDDGVPVDGAEVFVNGRSLGVTPLEAELDTADEQIALKIKKEGFTTHEVGVTRNGRSVIGPATIALVRSAGGTPTPTEVVPTEVAPPTPPTETPPKPTEPVKTEPVKVAAAETPKPTEPKPATPTPVATEKPKPTETPKPTEPKPTTPTPVVAEKPKSNSKNADIQLGTSPYADTTIDGRKYGMTPFFGPRTLTLPVGTHKIEFFDKVNNKKYKYQLKLKAPDPNNKVVIQFNKNDPPKVEGQVELKKLE